MTFNSTARVPTGKASRYLQQLCKHWSHNLAVEFTEQNGKVVFPRNARGAEWPGDATLTMQAHDDGLDCRLEASAAGQLERAERRRRPSMASRSRSASWPLVGRKRP